MQALAERLHCLPSQLEREDVGALLRNIALLDLYRDAQDVQRGGKMKDNVARAIMLEAEEHEHGE